ncbi:lysylphosphatidylglycerol synthase domain-containing protein, partial [Brevibacterium aurantiacum]
RAEAMRTMWLRRVLMLLITVALLGLTVRIVGIQALLEGGRVVTPLTILASLGLGLLATAGQAMRFSLLLKQSGTHVTPRRALADCYSASLLNMILPGGLGGDMARVAAYRNSGPRRWLSPLTVVGAERLSATTLLFATATFTLLPVASRFAWIAAAVAAATCVLSILGMRGMAASTIGIVWLTAAVTIGSFLGLYLTAMAALGGPVIPALAVVGLAAMSIPLGVGGWGVREVSVSILAGSLASSVEWAVTSSTGYGLLATISTLPGAITLVVRLVGRRHYSGESPPRSHRSQAR